MRFSMVAFPLFEVWSKIVGLGVLLLYFNNLLHDHASHKLVETHRAARIPSKILKFSTRVYIQLYHVHGTAGTKSTQILNLVYSYTKFAAAASCDACARAYYR